MEEDKETKKEDCVFCKIINGEIPADKVANEENFIIINDINAVSDGHCLIIPKKHYNDLFEIPSSIAGELFSIAKKQGLRLIQEGKADGIKLVQNNGASAGQTVMHFHLHVIPEKTGVKREKSV
jgi:histidine triad (HIT) family protein